MAEIIAGAEYTASQNCIIAGFMNLKMNTSCPVILNGLPVGYYSSPTDKNTLNSKPILLSLRLSFSVSICTLYKVESILLNVDA